MKQFLGVIVMIIALVAFIVDLVAPIIIAVVMGNPWFLLLYAVWAIPIYIGFLIVSVVMALVVELM